MTNFISQLGQSVLSSSQGIQYADNFSTVDLLHNTDSIYQIEESPEISYKIDRIIISPEQLSSIKIESLSEFKRTEILQHQLGKWNNHPASTISINFPLTEFNCKADPNNSLCIRCVKLLESNLNITLDKLTFRIEGIEGQDPNKVYNLKDYWPVHGTELAFKLDEDEGLRVRQLLSLGSNQDIRIVTNKLLPETPTVSLLDLPNENSSSKSSINTDLVSLSDSLLFYQSELHEIISTDINTDKPLPKLPINMNKSLPLLPEYWNKMNIKSCELTVPTIFEESETLKESESESEFHLLRNSTASSSTSSITSSDLSEIGCVTGRNLYAYPHDTGLRDAILGMMTDVEKENVVSINQQLNTTPTPAGANTNENLGNIIKSLNKSSDSLSSLLDEERIANLPDKNTSKTIFDTDLSLKNSDIQKVFHYRSISPISPNSSSENLLSKTQTVKECNLQDDID